MQSTFVLADVALPFFHRVEASPPREHAHHWCGQSAVPSGEMWRWTTDQGGLVNPGTDHDHGIQKDGAVASVLDQ